jgi:hypothetical protein
MEKLYFRKIREGEMNPATGDHWKIEDVPLLWRHKVILLLQEG